MDKESGRGGKTYIEPIKWCRHLITAGYATAALIILAHVIWYFAARNVLAFPPRVYLQNYILLPAAGLSALAFLTDLYVRSARISLLAKEYLSLSLFVVFSFYLTLTHDIATVLLGSYILPIFVSTVFSNIKITRWMFWMSCFAVLLFGGEMYRTGKLDSSMLMQIFVAWFMFLCAFLQAKILIRHGHDHLAALTSFDRRQRYMQEQLKRDSFTGLYNRKCFGDELPKLMDECRSTGKCLSLAMIDVDRFKNVNDLYGHPAGDRVLLYLSQILKDIRAENILVFRLGGDEFAVLFRDCDEEEAHRICENVRTRMESAALRDINKKSVTFSCGLACMRAEHAVSPEALTKAADSALYAAKNSGRNQSVVCVQISDTI